MRSARAPSGDLTLTCEPEDAEVSVDDVPRGLCKDFADPHGLSVGQGMHRIDVQKQGYQPYRTYYSPGGARASLHISLQHS